MQDSDEAETRIETPKEPGPIPEKCAPRVGDEEWHRLIREASPWARDQKPGTEGLEEYKRRYEAGEKLGPLVGQPICPESVSAALDDALDSPRESFPDRLRKDSDEAFGPERVYNLGGNLREMLAIRDRSGRLIPAAMVYVEEGRFRVEFDPRFMASIPDGSEISITSDSVRFEANRLVSGDF